uniref:ORF1/1 n=1 Tax=Torque teno sus virus 1b TaxID=687387 RepID=A0A385FPQ7_9VIRU|nr:ORF1/1 [Torque teno sus virus 1b]
MRFRRRRFGRRRRYYRKRRWGWRRRYGRRWRRTAWRRRRFGGEYQPPTGIRDPCVDNPSYPVPQSGSVTHPMYAGKGGLTTKIGASGITLSSLRALCAAPPQEISQSAFLGGQKKEEGEETEETTSESSITSAESSSEGDGSSENEERRARRRRNKRRLRIFLQRLADRPLDHKRRRFSE